MSYADEGDYDKYNDACTKLAEKFDGNSFKRSEELKLARKWVEKLEARSAANIPSPSPTASLHLQQMVLAHDAGVQLVRAEAGDNEALAHLHFARMQEEMS